MEIDKRLGPLDILVSNAGIGIFVPSIVEMSLDDWGAALSGEPTRGSLTAVAMVVLLS